MALGCFLWISGICFLLFNGSVGLPTIQVYGYPYKTPSRNMGDYAEDEKLLSYNGQPSDGKPSGAAYTSYNRPPAAWEPISVASPKTEPSGYSSEPLYQRYPSDAGAHQVASSAKGSSPPAQMSYQAQIPVASPEEEVSVSGHYPPPPPPPPPPLNIIQSRNGYVRVSYRLNKSRYSPGYASPAAVNSEPERKQPAAPVGVKNHQRKV